VVIAGSVEAIAAAEEKLVAEGITTYRLRTATAFHSPLVAPASQPLRDVLNRATVHPPRREVYGNADAAPYPVDAEEVRRRVAEHLIRPVRFLEQIEAMYGGGVRTFVEVGAGATLTRLVGRILGDREHCAVSLD